MTNLYWEFAHDLSYGDVIVKQIWYWGYKWYILSKWQM